MCYRACTKNLTWMHVPNLWGRSYKKMHTTLTLTCPSVSITKSRGKEDTNWSLRVLFPPLSHLYLSLPMCPGAHLKWIMHTTLLHSLFASGEIKLNRICSNCTCVFVGLLASLLSLLIMPVLFLSSCWSRIVDTFVYSQHASTFPRHHFSQAGNRVCSISFGL